MKEKPPGQEPSKPEQTQPLQGNAEGKRSLQGPTTFDSSGSPKIELYRDIHRSRQRIDQLVEEAEKLAGQSIQAANTLDGVFSPQTTSKNKEQKQTGIRGLINRGYERVKGLAGRSKPTEPSGRK